MDNLWNLVTICLKENLSDSAFQTFQSSIFPKNIEKNTLFIEVLNNFLKTWFKDKCEPLLKLNLPDVSHLIFEYIIKSKSSQKEKQLDIFTIPTKKIKKPDFLNPKYTFDQFVVGQNNKFAFASCESICDSTTKNYNPLFIYSPVGLGKTHLVHAIGHELIKKNANTKIKLVSCEKFTNDLINSFKDKTVDEFRSKYRHLDLLIVDDIQFLSGKVQTQEEFFHTFNDLYNNNSQIVLTSDRTPKDIPTLELRLRTRFEWGLLVDMQAPELETRIAILQKKAEANQYNIPDEIINFIATQVSTNVREMEGALNRVIAYASLLNTEVTLSIANNVIKDLLHLKDEKPISIEDIQHKTCEFFQLSIHELCSKIRTKEIAYARQICMYLSRELTQLSLPKIGEKFGKRDHTTVIHAYEKIKKMRITNPETNHVLKNLISTLKSTTTNH